MASPLHPLEDPKPFQKALASWFKKNARSLPWRSNRTPYTVVISEFMLQQTQVITVIPYFERWLKQFPDWKYLAEAGEPEVLKAWEGLGYYSRARNLHRLAKTVVYEHQGVLPSDLELLKALPGIGPYTAGAITSFAFGQSVPLLDGNVERIFARIFNIEEEIKSTSVQKQLWNIAAVLVPKRTPDIHNEALMELGATICTPKKPQCLICPVQSFCTAENPEALPKRTRTKATRLQITYAILREGKSLWMQAPETPGRWKGFHRLPEYSSDTMKSGKALGDLKFTITRFRIEATVIEAQWKQSPPDGSWIPMNQLTDLPLPAPIRRMLKFL
ncbi:MAG: A/G-specific adenine glycosylase [Verrucomicrobiota bacterium]